MNDEPEFELKVVESLQSYPPREERERVALADSLPTPEDVLKALRSTKGAAEALERIPNINELPLWLPIATFTVQRKTGTAAFLDIWDADHFDEFTDMQRCLNDSHAWFSGDGYQYWGSGQTKTGHVNCYFTAPSDGYYVCNAQLQSFPTSSPAVVECLIDGSSFGQLTVLGTIIQPHVANLVEGGHHFRIRQVAGSFFFLSLTVWRA